MWWEENPYTFGGNGNWCSHCVKQYGDFSPSYIFDFWIFWHQMISLSACASLSPSSMSTGAPIECVKAKSSSESDLVSSTQEHHMGFCPTRSRCKIPLHDPHTNQAYFCLGTSTFTHGFLPIYTWLVQLVFWAQKKKKNTHTHTHILHVTVCDLLKTLKLYLKLHFPFTWAFSSQFSAVLLYP